MASSVDDDPIRSPSAAPLRERVRETMVADEIQAIHERARNSFLGKDLSGFMEIYSPTLLYRLFDGRVIDRDQLRRDVDRQFRTYDRFRIFSDRESLEVDGDRAEEYRTQSSSASLSAFLVVQRTWNVVRRSRIVWARSDGRWRVEEVEVLGEEIDGRVRLGFRVGPGH